MSVACAAVALQAWKCVLVFRNVFTGLFDRILLRALASATSGGIRIQIISIRCGANSNATVARNSSGRSNQPAPRVAALSSPPPPPPPASSLLFFARILPLFFPFFFPFCFLVVVDVVLCCVSAVPASSACVYRRYGA